MENNLSLGICYHVEVERIAAEEEKGLEEGDNRTGGVVSSTDDGDVQHLTLPNPNLLQQSEKYWVNFSLGKAEYCVTERIRCRTEDGETEMDWTTGEKIVRH